MPKIIFPANGHCPNCDAVSSMFLVEHINGSGKVDCPSCEAHFDVKLVLSPFTSPVVHAEYNG